MATSYRTPTGRMTARRFYGNRVNGLKRGAKVEAHRVVRRQGKVESRDALVEENFEYFSVCEYCGEETELVTHVCSEYWDDIYYQMRDQWAEEEKFLLWDEVCTECGWAVCQCFPGVIRGVCGYCGGPTVNGVCVEGGKD